MPRLTVLLLILSLGATGCVAAKVRPLTGPRAQPESLAFLRDGETDREIVRHLIGKPTKTFDSARLVVYRLDGKMQITGGWDATRFNLVLIFDERDVLQRHAIVRVK